MGQRESSVPETGSPRLEVYQEQVAFLSVKMRSLGVGGVCQGESVYCTNTRKDLSLDRSSASMYEPGMEAYSHDSSALGSETSKSLVFARQTVWVKRTAPDSETLCQKTRL